MFPAHLKPKGFLLILHIAAVNIYIGAHSTQPLPP